jgi:general secretion pathway protein G
LILGGDDAYASAAVGRLTKAPTTTAPAIAAALSRVAKDNPCFVMRINLGPLMGVFESLGKDSATGQASDVTRPPFVIDFRAGIAGRIWEGGFAFDVSELGQFVKSVQQSAENKSAAMRASVDVRALKSAVTFYMTRNGGKPPATLDVLVVPDEHGEKFYSAGKLPLDPWGHAYVYTNDGKSFRIVSYGSDGKPGGVGDAADIESE